MAHLGEIPGICLISLQKGEGTEQITELDGRFPVSVLQDPGGGDEDRRSLLDTAAVMHHLDLVVTPDSAVAHLAGSLGVRLWVALPAVAEWRWMMDRDDSPWYPTMTLFRQSTPGDWDGVFRRMACNLKDEIVGGCRRQTEVIAYAMLVARSNNLLDGARSSGAFYRFE